MLFILYRLPTYVKGCKFKIMKRKVENHKTPTHVYRALLTLSPAAVKHRQYQGIELTVEDHEQQRL